MPEIKETKLVCEACGQLAFWGYWRDDYSMKQLVASHKLVNPTHKVWYENK